MGLASYEPIWPGFAGTSNATGLVVRYWWRELALTLRKWLGERKYQELATRSFDVPNEPYEGSVKVSTRLAKYGQLEEAGTEAEALGLAVRKHPDILIHEKMVAGRTTLLAWDGQPFYDTSHPVNVDRPGLGTYPNSFNLALDATGFGTVQQSMSAIKGPDGYPMVLGATWVLHVSSKLRDRAAALLESQVLVQAFAGNAATGAASNIYRGRAALLVDPYLDLDDPDRWYLHAHVGNFRPWYVQVLEDRGLQEQAAGSDPEFERNEWHFGVSWDGGIAPGLPQLSATSSPN